MTLDWETLTCAVRSHVTYRPHEAEVAARVRATTPVDDEVWRCLRCAAFVPGEPAASGPAADAPQVMRGGQLRDLVIMRLLALDRFFHFVVLTAVGLVILGLQTGPGRSLREAFAADAERLDAVATELGWNAASSRSLRVLEEAFTLSPTTVRWIGLAVLVYGLLELVEATGLWLGHRWGEYFSVVVTGIFIPLEIYELVERVTAFKLLALAINVAAVVWLIWRKRLFGVRGGLAAHRASHAATNLLDAPPA